MLKGSSIRCNADSTLLTECERRLQGSTDVAIEEIVDDDNFRVISSALANTLSAQDVTAFAASGFSIRH